MPMKAENGQKTDKRHETSCGVVVFRQMSNDLKVLIIQHRFGHVSFPKGHMEAGEDLKQTAIRECFEETGIKVHIASDFNLTTKYSPAPDITKTVHFFLAEYVGGYLRPQISEISHVGFMSITDALKKITYEADRNVLKKALAKYQEITNAN